MALELLLLCLRALYFCMAAEKVGALLRMVLIVIKVSLGAVHLLQWILAAYSITAMLSCTTLLSLVWCRHMLPMFLLGH